MSSVQKTSDPGHSKVDSMESPDSEFCIEKLVAKDPKGNLAELAQRLTLNSHSLRFVDKTIEAKFKRHFLLSTSQFQKNMFFGLSYLLVLLCWICREVTHEKQRHDHDLFWVITGLHSIVALGDGIFILLLWSSRFRPKMLTHQHTFFFHLVMATGLCFSIRLFTHSPQTGDHPHWTPHAMAIVALCGMVRVHWLHQLVGVTFLVSSFWFCSFLAGFSRCAIGDSLSALLLLSLISLAGVYTAENLFRTVFKHQEISLFMANQHSIALQECAAQAQSNDEAKSCFVANMSHELRTPLHGVITALDLLKSSSDLTPEQEDYVQVAENSSGLMLDIINNILTITKIEAKKVVLDCEPIDLRSIVESVSVVFAQIAAQKGVEVCSFVPPMCPIHLLSDAVRLKQILFNLVSNAVKFTEKGVVSIRVSVDNETDKDVSLTISVSDSGVGVHPDSLHLLFQRFSQVDGSSFRKFQGTGLGLALVVEFSKLFGGKMDVHSEGLGKGTRFSFSATFLKNELATPAVSALSSSSLPIVQSLRANAVSAHRWPAFIFHKEETVASGLSSYLSHLGIAPSTILDPSLSFDALKDTVQSQLSAGHSSAGGISKWSLVVLDGSICHQSHVIKVLEHVTALNRPHSTSLLVLVLEDPTKPANLDILRSSDCFKTKNSCNPTSKKKSFSSAAAKPIWILKKPCRFHKIQELIREMKTFAVWHSDHHGANGRSLADLRRFSAPVLGRFFMRRGSKLCSMDSEWSSTDDSYFGSGEEGILPSVSVSHPMIHQNVPTSPNTTPATSCPASPPSSRPDERRQSWSGGSGGGGDGPSGSSLTRRSSQSLSGGHTQQPQRSAFAPRRFRHSMSTNSLATVSTQLPPRGHHHHHHNQHHQSMVSFDQLSTYRFGSSSDRDESESLTTPPNESCSGEHINVQSTPTAGSGARQPQSSQQRRRQSSSTHNNNNSSSNSILFTISNDQQQTGSLMTDHQIHMPESKLLQNLIAGKLGDEDSGATCTRNNAMRSPSPVLTHTHSGGSLVVNSSPQDAAARRVSSNIASSNCDSPMASEESVMEPHKRVLVADDNHINRRLTERLLTKGGFHCTSVEDGSLAVEAAKQTRFALIFMDITMPIMDGCTATQLIQEHQQKEGMSQKTLICALSAADTDRFSGANFDAVLPKPVKPAELMEVARELTEKFRKQITTNTEK